MEFKEGFFKKNKLHAASVKVHQIIEVRTTHENLNLIKICIYTLLNLCRSYTFILYILCFNIGTGNTPKPPFRT
jgi:hypothetical protein